MFGLLKKPSSATVGVAPLAPPRVAPSREAVASQAAPNAPPPQPALVDRLALTSTSQVDATHYSVFAEVPKFISILTAGEQPVLPVPANLKSFLVVLEQAGRRALIVTSAERVIEKTQIESMRGSLLGAGWSIEPLATAAEEVIAAIYGASTASGVASSNFRSNQFKDACREWVEYALDNDATDIHLETHGSVGAVRFRIHGEIEDMRTKTKGRFPAKFVIDCMGTLYNQLQQKKSSGGSQFEPDKNLYCMIPYSDISGHTLKLRYQSIKGNEGPKAVLRLLHVGESKVTKGFKELGYADSHCNLLETAMATPSGACLISGITGSGKSTTLKSFIELNPGASNSSIYTVEDPVEYPIRHTHQVPIQRDLANPNESARMYNETISALMRLDPDVGVLGEIRDRFSAMALQQFTESGHMGLGTVHAHLISGIVPRLTNPEIGMNREVLTAPNMLTLLVYQALVPKLCPQCAMTSEEGAANTPDVSGVVKHIDGLGLDRQNFKWRRMGGCEVCKNRGTVGLTVVAEMIMPDDEWLKLIRENRDTEAVAHYRSMSNRDLTSPNMDGKTAFEHTLYKALQGEVDARQCSRFDVWARYVKNNRRPAIALVA